MASRTCRASGRCATVSVRLARITWRVHGMLAGHQRRGRRRHSVSALGAKKRNENFASRQTADPLAKCYIAGVPRIMYLELPIQIFQSPARAHDVRMVAELPAYLHRMAASRRRASSSGWATRAATGKATRSSSTSPITTTDLVRHGRQLPQRGAAAGRALHDARSPTHRLPGDGTTRRSSRGRGRSHAAHRRQGHDPCARGPSARRRQRKPTARFRGSRDVVSGRHDESADQPSCEARRRGASSPARYGVCCCWYRSTGTAQAPRDTAGVPAPPIRRTPTGMPDLEGLLHARRRRRQLRARAARVAFLTRRPVASSSIRRTESCRCRTGQGRNRRAARSRSAATTTRRRTASPAGVPRSIYVPSPFEIRPDARLRRDDVRAHVVADHPARRTQTSARRHPSVAGRLGRSLGRRHARRRVEELQRQDLAEPGR